MSPPDDRRRRRIDALQRGLDVLTRERSDLSIALVGLCKEDPVIHRDLKERAHNHKTTDQLPFPDRGRVLLMAGLSVRQ